MDNELLYRYLQCRTTGEEEARVLAWLEADPEHRERMAALCGRMETMALLSPRIGDLYAESRMKGRRRMLRRWCAVAAAAVVALCAVAVHLTASHYRRTFGSMERIVAAQNAPLRYTLEDGTTVWLNTGATLAGSAVFTGCERSVRIVGEAMFEVAPDARRPFVVHTAACDVRVLGTKFNVEADAAGKVFGVALLRGCVEVMPHATHERIILTPSQTVTLRDGAFVRSSIADTDDYLWTDGYINLKGHTFGELIERFRKAFGVRIDTGDMPLPEGRYQWGRIRISDGVDNAMKVLQDSYPIRYTFDPEHRTVVVRPEEIR